MKNYLLIPVLLFAFTCQAQNTAASPDKKASKEDPQLIGKWKIKDFNMVKAPKGVSAEWKADFSKKTKEVGTCVTRGATLAQEATVTACCLSTPKAFPILAQGRAAHPGIGLQRSMASG